MEGRAYIDLQVHPPYAHYPKLRPKDRFASEAAMRQEPGEYEQVGEDGAKKQWKPDDEKKEVERESKAGGRGGYRKEWRYAAACRIEREVSMEDSGRVE